MTFLPLAQAASPGEGQPAPNPLIQFLPIILIVVIMYMLLIRPQQKKNKEHQELVKKLKAGDQVVTAGGIHGTIASVQDKTIVVEVAENVQIEFNRASVTTVRKKGEAE